MGDVTAGFSGLVIGETAKPRSAINLANSRAICGVWLPRRGQHCRVTALMACGRCSVHGGKTPRGLASHRTASGMYSKAMPRDLRKMFDAVMSGQDPLTLMPNLALEDTRIAQLLAQLGDGGDWSAKCEQKWRETSRAIKAGDVPAMLAGMKALDELCQRRTETDKVWREIHAAQKVKKQLAAAEWKRRVDLRQVIPVDQMMLFVNAIASLITTHVTLREDRRKVLEGVEAILRREKEQEASQNCVIEVGLLTEVDP
jgi:hypothetical protein